MCMIGNGRWRASHPPHNQDMRGTAAPRSPLGGASPCPPAASHDSLSKIDVLKMHVLSQMKGCSVDVTSSSAGTLIHFGKALGFGLWINVHCHTSGIATKYCDWCSCRQAIACVQATALRSCLCSLASHCHSPTRCSPNAPSVKRLLFVE